MKVVAERLPLLIRPVAALFNGIAIGVLLPAAAAHWVGEKAGRLCALVLIPIWLVLALLAMPVAIVYCFVMVFAKGPLWQYPPDKRHSVDWSAQDERRDRGTVG